MLHLFSVSHIFNQVAFAGFAPYMNLFISSYFFFQNNVENNSTQVYLNIKRNAPVFRECSPTEEY